MTATDNNDDEFELETYNLNSLSGQDNKVKHNTYSINNDFVIGLVSGLCVSFMLDTEASVSLISEDMHIMWNQISKIADSNEHMLETWM